MEIEIFQYEPRYATHFFELNIQWLKEFFYVEPIDDEILRNPEKYIIDLGGHILLMRDNEVVIGSLALMPTDEIHQLELSKMAILPRYRGLGLGNKLLKHSIDFCREIDIDTLVLYSNRKLQNAIHLYRKFGFKEIEIERNSPYKRSDIKMILRL